MKTLHKKLWRDSRRLAGQILTIAFVIASGIAVFIAAISAYYSLETSRSRYYADSRFADVFVSLKRAPMSVAARAADIDGVQAVDARLVYDVTLSVPDETLPIAGRMISLPATGAQAINRLSLTRGREIDPERHDELLVNLAFADANGLKPGDEITALLNGRRQTFRIVGIVLSPEYVFATGAGDPLPDDKRFGVFYTARETLAHAFSMEGAFNDLALAVAPDANLRAIEEELDRLLLPWGGLAAHDRSLQSSHRFLQDELKQQGTMAATVPPVFLLVSAFLLHVVLGRLVAAQRESIATLKSLGYGHEIGWHFAQFALIAVTLGIALGVALGIGFGHLMLFSYVPYFHFPELVFVLPAWAPVVASVIALFSGVVGALKAVRDVMALQPAEAMRPPAPRAYSSRLARSWCAVPARWMIAVRGALDHPLRAILTLCGIVATMPLVLMSMFWTDALDYMVDVQFAASERADAVTVFYEALPARVLDEARRYPGVTIAEPIRSVPVRLRAANRNYQTSLLGLSDDLQLRRAIDQDLVPLSVANGGLFLSRRLGERLRVAPGDIVDVDVLEGRRETTRLPVAGFVNDLIGTSAYVDRDRLHDLLRESDLVGAVAVRLSSEERDAFYAAVKGTPKIATVTLKDRSIRNFRESTGQIVLLFAGVFTLFAVTIAFGVVYNSARIAFHERTVEIATLRILGFRRLEAAGILFSEIIAEILFAIPLGLLAGYHSVRVILRAFETEMFEIPPAIAPLSYLLAVLLVAGSALLSMVLIGRNLWRLDLASILKGQA